VSTRHAVARAVDRERPDVAHLHWARYLPFLATGTVPVIVHVHGSDVRGRNRTLTGRLVTRSMRRAAAVLVATPDLLDHTVPGARYLPNPVDVDEFGPRTEPGGPAAGPTILLYSRLSTVKGAAQSIEIARRLRAASPDLTVLAIGGGEHDVEAAAAGVRLLPRMSRAEVAALLRRVDVVVGQQHLQMLGLSELEAMAAERPVVMPLRAGDYAESPPVEAVDDPGAAAEACVALLNDPSRRRDIGRRARDYVERHHAPAVVASQLAGIYAEVLGQEPGA
jgi:glycosyltransferase involved in cell wall biosynthesis